MSIVRYNPYRRVMRVRPSLYEMQELLNPNYSDPRLSRMALNVREDDDSYFVETMVPGLSEEEISVEVNDNVLTITAEIKRENEEDNAEANYRLREFGYSKTQRSLRLPKGIEAEKIEASLEKGVLTITLPKAEEVKPKQVEIKVLGSGK
jgi:HSP20 family protein